MFKITISVPADAVTRDPLEPGAHYQISVLVEGKTPIWWRFSGYFLHSQFGDGLRLLTFVDVAKLNSADPEIRSGQTIFSNSAQITELENQPCL